MLSEFRKFILKGNVIDLSTGVIMGAAFTSVVTAFTKGIVEPILALAGGGPSPKLTVPIMNRMVEVSEKLPSGEIKTQMVNKLIELDLGIILGAGFSFLITSVVVFFVIIKPMNKLLDLSQRKGKAEPEEAAPVTPEDIALLREIRDLLRSQSTPHN
jgi:large conductance mechanosensitive channel